MKLERTFSNSILNLTYGSISVLIWDGATKGKTYNSVTGQAFEYPYLDFTFEGKTFCKEPEFGYDGLPHRSLAIFIHEVLHAYIHHEIGRGVLLDEMTAHRPEHRPYYVAEEIIVRGIEIEFNQQFHTRKLDNSLFWDFMSQTYEVEETASILAYGLKLCAQTVEAIGQSF